MATINTENFGKCEFRAISDKETGSQNVFLVVAENFWIGRDKLVKLKNYYAKKENHAKSYAFDLSVKNYDDDSIKHKAVIYNAAEKVFIFVLNKDKQNAVKIDADFIYCVTSMLKEQSKNIEGNKEFQDEYADLM
jgi:hypothetical protein